MKTEFEINKRLADLLGWNIVNDNPTPNKGLLVVSSEDQCRAIDYCNSWADMGPIILKNGIDVISPDSNGSKYWQCVKFYPNFQYDIHSVDLNPLKAAALVAIKILESKE